MGKKDGVEMTNMILLMSKIVIVFMKIGDQREWGHDGERKLRLRFGLVVSNLRSCHSIL